MIFSIRVREHAGGRKMPAILLDNEEQLSTPEGRAEAIEQVVRRAEKYFGGDFARTDLKVYAPSNTVPRNTSR